MENVPSPKVLCSQEAVNRGVGKVLDRRATGLPDLDALQHDTRSFLFPRPLPRLPRKARYVGRPVGGMYGNQVR